MILPKAAGIPLVSRIKIMAKLDIADRLRPQGGHASVFADGKRIDLRVSTLPASHGEKVVIRILDPRSAIRSLDSLGMSESDHERLSRLLDVREGLVLVTGPTGSGKTTTLYAALRQIKQRGLNIITVEDPVEYRIAGIVQVQINEKAGLSFASALRSILRQDPDVVLIGEIRDRETMESAIMLAGTGHLVLATLHANNAAETLDRIINMFPRDQHTQIFLDLSQYLRAIIAQRLVPGKNKRRAAAVELLINTPHVQELIKKGDVIGAKEALRTSSEKGMQHFDTALYELYRAGRITLEDALTYADSRTNLEAKINFG
jgi:pilus retraction protein PilT